MVGPRGLGAQPVQRGGGTVGSLAEFIGLVGSRLEVGARVRDLGEEGLVIGVELVGEIDEGLVIEVTDGLAVERAKGDDGLEQSGTVTDGCWSDTQERDLDRCVGIVAATRATEPVDYVVGVETLCRRGERGRREEVVLSARRCHACATW